MDKRVVDLIRRKGLQRRDGHFALASGQVSHDYVDGKRAVAKGSDLRAVAEAAIAACAVDFDAVGGLTMGADPLAHAVAIVADCLWFSVRKEPKGRGSDQWIEGAELHSGRRVLLVDDVVTTGGSIIKAHAHVASTGAQVVAAVAQVDRGDVTRLWFEARGVPFRALVTYHDLGIDAVGSVTAGSPGSTSRRSS